MAGKKKSNFDWVNERVILLSNDDGPPHRAQLVAPAQSSLCCAVHAYSIPTGILEDSLRNGFFISYFNASPSIYHAPKYIEPTTTTIIKAIASAVAEAGANEKREKKIENERKFNLILGAAKKAVVLRRCQETISMQICVCMFAHSLSVQLNSKRWQ